MNTWWYRAAGAIGVAGGLLLLGGPTAAYADPVGPQPVTGAVKDLLGGSGGLLGGTSGLVDDHDAVPGVVSGPVIVPAGPPRRTQTETHGPQTLPAPGNLPVGPAASVVSPLAPATGGGSLPLGDLLSGGDLLSDDLLGGLSPDQLSSSEPTGQLPALLGGRMGTQRPELFTGGLPLLGGLDGLPILAGRTPGTMPQGGTPITAKDARAFSDSARPVAGN